MASTNKTENIGLNQWVASDPVLREDFNADNAKIDAALKSMGEELTNGLEGIRSGLLKVTTGSYVGTGTSGSTNPNTLTFDFEPLLVFVSYSRYLAIFCKGAPYATVVGAHGFSYNGNTYAWFITDISWAENAVIWYTTDTSSPPSSQLNISGATYNYIAIGI